MSAPTRSRPRIDPRIRRRRVQVVRARGRRRLRLLAAAVVVALLAVAVYGVAQSSLLGVNEIVVRGAASADPEEIREAAGIEVGDPILFVDLSGAARRIEGVPWIESAQVTRDLPRSITVEVTERVPVAWARQPGETAALIDASGRVLAVEPRPPDLPELAGLDPVPAEPGATITPAELAAVAPELPAALAHQVVQVVLAQEGREPGAVLVLASGVEVRLGTLEELAEKASAALAVIAGLGDASVDYVDVRVPSVVVTG